MARFEFLNKTFNLAPDFSWTIGGIKQMLSDKRFTVKSDVFQWKEYPHVSTRVKFQLKHGGVYLSLHAEPPNKDPGLNPFPTIYYVIQSANGRSPKLDHVVAINRLFGWGPHQFLSCENHKLINSCALALSSFNRADSALLQVYVEPPAMAQRVYSYEGILNWSLEKFDEKRKALVEELALEQESPCFYTGPGGYRVRVFLRLTPTSLQFHVCFLAGEFDKDLSKSFFHSTTVTLLRRSNPERNVVKQTHKDIINGPAYIVEKLIDKDVEELIEDDTLFYSVSIRSWAKVS